MKFILHIGMGKTGTSAIQHALTDSRKTLAAQHACYLGMWFDMLDPKYHGIPNQRLFLDLPEPEMRARAREFFAILEKKAGAENFDTFIMSNETLAGRQETFGHFVDELRKVMPVRLVAYVRNPASWLPSAYAQWGISHKTYAGKITSFPERGRQLIFNYENLMRWADTMGDILSVHHYDAAPDVVEDFARVIGFTLNIPEGRRFRRREDAELVMRALFNNRFEHEALSRVFNNTVLPYLRETPQLDTMVDHLLDHSALAGIIEEQAPIFDRIRDQFGINLRAEATAPPRKPDMDKLRHRLLDFLLEMNLSQAQRIKRLEHRIDILEGKKKPGET